MQSTQTLLLQGKDVTWLLSIAKCISVVEQASKSAVSNQKTVTKEWRKK